MKRRATVLLAIVLLVTACGADQGTGSTPSAAASAQVLPDEGDLAAGNYSLSDFPVAITFAVPPSEPPAVWFVCSPSRVEQAVCRESNTAAVSAVTFQIVDNVVAGCSDQETAELLDPPVGPSVDDLVTAISNLEGYEATDPIEIGVSGFDGREFTLTAVRHGCGATWATADRVTGMGSDESNLLRIVDVDGVRVVIAGAYHTSTSDEDVAEVEQIMDSVQIGP